MSDILNFNLEGSGRRVEGDRAIYPMSFLFRPGDYPDKKFSMTEEGINKIIDTFSNPVPGNIEHTDFLKGRACQIDKVFGIKEKGSLNLRGEVSVPLGLDNILEDHEKRLSCEFDRATGDLTGLALCINPRIEEAVLMTEFKKGDTTSHGQYTLQDIHDRSARAGAVCNFDAAKMTSKPEYKTIQAIHDMTTSSGATCKTGTAGSYYYTKDDPMDEEKFTKNVIDSIKDFLHPKKTEEETPVVKMTNTENERIINLEKQLAQEKDTRFMEFAKEKTESLFKEGKIEPSEKEDVFFAIYTAKKDDDKDNTKVKFTDGKTEKSRLDLALGIIENRTPVKLGRELIPSELNGARALFNSSTETEDKEFEAQINKYVADQKKGQ